VRRLHRLPHHTYQIVVEGFQIGLVPEPGGESFQCLPRVVLPTVDALTREMKRIYVEGSKNQVPLKDNCGGRIALGGLWAPEGPEPRQGVQVSPEGSPGRGR
jgi:hypothetical protein